MTKTVSLIIIIVISVVGFNLWSKSKANSDRSRRNYATATHEFSTTDPSSFWVIVNKQKPLRPKAYVPTDLVVPTVPLRDNITDDESRLVYAAAEALNNMVKAAGQQNVALNLQSGYRSYDLQKKLYDNYTELQGESEANVYSALPGYSEHQTGLAVDLGSVKNPACNIRLCFEDTDESKWLKANAYKYGFILRYPKDKQKVTGYEYEPWHLRYVGIYLATQMKHKDITTLEDYFKS